VKDPLSPLGKRARVRGRQDAGSVFVNK